MKKIDAARATVKNFREKRETAKTLSEEASKQQPEVIALLESLGVDNEQGIIFDENDPNKGTAYVQQNKGSEVWDEEAIMDWLSNKSRRSLRLKSSSMVFDIRKWEALVASKEVPTKVALKFKKTTEPPKPFIRFGKKKENSL